MKEGVAAEAVPDIFLKLDKMRHKKWLNFQVLGNETVIDPFFLSDAHSLGACCLKRRCRKHGNFWDKVVGIFVSIENIAKLNFTSTKSNSWGFPVRSWEARISWITTSFSSQNSHKIDRGHRTNGTNLKSLKSLSINFRVLIRAAKRQLISWDKL